jgi:autotransporter adhesin
MPAAYTNLYIEQGTTYSTTITLDDVNNNAYNLTGYKANSQIRKSYYSTNASGFFTTTIGTSNGTVTLSLSASTSANIAPGRYVYDTKIIDSSNNVTRILEGIVEIAPSVSR